MASGTQFHSLCVWLIISAGILLGCARIIDAHRDVPRDLCFGIPNGIDELEEDCKYGSFSICGRTFCRGGPGDKCRAHDEFSRCHPELVCSCNKCMGCVGVGQTDCHVGLCPSSNLYNSLRKRFERNMRQIDV